MGWDGAIHGRIQVPADQREAWLASPLDWQAVEGHEAWDQSVCSATVAEVLAMTELPDFSEAPQFLEFRWRANELQVASFLAEDSFSDCAIEIAAAWAAAAALGGRGQLVAMGMLTASFGFELRVGDGQATFASVDEDDVFDLDDHRDAKAIKALVEAAIEAMIDG